MYVARVSTRVPLTKQSAAQLSKAVASFAQCNSLSNHIKGQPLTINRSFSSTSQNRLRDFFPEPDHNQIIKTPPAWPHPGFIEADMRKNVFTAHREPKDFSDRIALGMVKLLKWGTDIATRYKHDVNVPAAISSSNPDGVTKQYQMSESKWLIRFVFLESVAAVPGMVAGMLRHLHSLRRLQRDNGWIETLLEEAYNERMHLLTFLKMAEPGWFMRFLCIGAQGVFFNSMFVAYLISPRTTHRFVGYLEEVAVNTYTLALEDLEKGLLPKWADEKFVIPDLAVGYWNMPEGHRTMKDLLLYIRADEAKHREVNHTLGNLDQKKDPNPYVSDYKTGNGNANKPRPSKGLEHSITHPVGWERNEVI